MPATLKDIIKEAMLFLGGETSIEQVKNFIVFDYGHRWKDIEVATAELAYSDHASHGSHAIPLPKKRASQHSKVI